MDVMAHCFTDEDPEPHGALGLIAYFVRDLPGMSNSRVTRKYGRAMMRRIAGQCAECRTEDSTRARITRMHSAYGRRSR